MQNRLLLSDICWTLFRSNTTMEYLDVVATSPRYRHYRRWAATAIGRACQLAIYRLTGVDIVRKIGIGSLRGLSREYLQQQAAEFYDNHLADKKIDAAWDTLQGRENVLVSSTLDVVAQAIGRHTGSRQIIASALEYHDGICTGRLLTDLTRHKWEATQSALALQPQQYDIMTDNLTDLPLISHAAQATVLTYRNQRRWQRATRQTTTPIRFIPIDDERRY